MIDRTTPDATSPDTRRDDRDHRTQPGSPESTPAGADHLTGQPDPTTRFEAERARLRSIAYRMLGTPDDADDVVQDAWLRWAAADHETIREPAGWLTTVTTRLAIDRLRSAQHQREIYVGPWLPEPVVTADDDPLLATASAESLTLHFLSILERLAPTERAVFLLHDVFGHPFGEVAAMVGRSPAATRQIASRARRRVQDEHKRFDTDLDEADALATAFLTAMVVGDMDGLRELLAPDVVHIADGGPEHRAARRVVHGVDRVARLYVNLAKRVDPDRADVQSVTVNGQRALLVRVDGRPFNLIVIGVEDGMISATISIVNRDKLRRFD